MTVLTRYLQLAVKSSADFFWLYDRDFNTLRVAHDKEASHLDDAETIT